jgi:hypothetical protein
MRQLAYKRLSLTAVAIGLLLWLLMQFTAINRITVIEHREQRRLADPALAHDALEHDHNAPPFLGDPFRVIDGHLNTSLGHFKKPTSDSLKQPVAIPSEDQAPAEIQDLQPPMALARALIPRSKELRLLRGVAPNEMAIYRRSGETGVFKCIVGGVSIQLADSSVNDDYCDCDDGSDEPGTSACINSRSSCGDMSS